MKAQGEMPGKKGAGGNAQLEDGKGNEERASTIDVCGPSDEDAPVREVQRVDDLSEIAHKPDD
ncbi:hypothetical protein [Paraburkholderia tagetis]|uniref:Uncharacterized protein n=1 Tax=Paraburkholderia tagetis TaxID=2913261 RepID=A0A9X1RUY5_9BURK|nr:hypothetical protein [Paraburkholderia tagetis]MCG5076934.1 hypothetical protein [Paraburkholderia tagetis]